MSASDDEFVILLLGNYGAVNKEKSQRTSVFRTLTDHFENRITARFSDSCKFVFTFGDNTNVKVSVKL